MCRRMQDASRIARDTWRCPHTLALAIAGGDASMERCTLRQAKKKVAEIEASMRSASRPSQHGNDARRRRSMVAARPALATACTADHVVASARSTASAGRRIATQAKVSEREKSRASAAVGCTSWADALGVFKICVKHSCKNCSPRQRRLKSQLDQSAPQHARRSFHPTSNLSVVGIAQSAYARASVGLLIGSECSPLFLSSDQNWQTAHISERPGSG